VCFIAQLIVLGLFVQEVSCLKNPALAVAWLANTLSRFGVTLNLGDIVMSGAWMPVVPAKQGDVFRLEGAGGVPFTLRFV
jgi:2-keto-4-pentenoate hydratase